MSFTPNPVKLAVRTQVHCGSIEFLETSRDLLFRPIVEQESYKPIIEQALRANSIEKVRRQWWSLTDAGAAGSLRVAKLTFKGGAFSEALRTGDVAPADRKLYDAFIEGGSISLDVRLSQDHIATLIIDLKY